MKELINKEMNTKNNGQNKEPCNYANQPDNSQMQDAVFDSFGFTLPFYLR